MKTDAMKVGLAGNLWFNRAENKFLGSDRIDLLEKIDELGSISKAARAMGLCYKTAWDLVNLVNNMAERPLVDRLTGGKGGGGTRLTAEGKNVVTRFKIIEEEHRKFLENLGDRLDDTDRLFRFLKRISLKVSARNTFIGTITELAMGAVNSEIRMTLKGGIALTAVITNGAIDNLGLKPGIEAYAIIKASSVLIGTDVHDVKVSTRNVFCGTVTKIIDGPVSTEVAVEIGGGTTVTAVITHDSANRLGLKVGSHACTLFEASSVIIGVS
ncbi:LysR family transcriptional regulator [Geobacter sp. FeAm09]|uniref:TOBE domain-containing protein n=1 Tax=Geobacter sp. FeAm09 TaxID=2597769 RepID=UPI0011EEE168|nr:TOBE domain-containing protein [Geobacter sp. FeAm09]QEM68588.1 LysR family transcriptional regulator [Geobacter sp. FeAm09]